MYFRREQTKAEESSHYCGTECCRYSLQPRHKRAAASRDADDDAEESKVRVSDDVQIVQCIRERRNQTTGGGTKVCSLSFAFERNTLVVFCTIERQDSFVSESG